LQIAWGLQLAESNMCKLENARGILELGLPSFPPSLVLSLPPVEIISFFPVGFLF
jgi:hypothetical protein